MPPGRGHLRAEGVIVDPTEPFLEVWHDLLGSYDEDDSPGTADVWSELAATHRGCQHRARLGDRVDAAEHHVRRSRQTADLVRLGCAVQISYPWSHGVEASGVLDRIDDPRNLERSRRAVVDLRPIGDELQDDPSGVGRVCRPEHRDAVRFEGGRGPRHARLTRRAPELTLYRWIQLYLKLRGHQAARHLGLPCHCMLAPASTLRPK